MRLLDRLERWVWRVMSVSWCDECQQGWNGRMGGSYWHADTCSHNRPVYPGRADDE